MYLLAVIVAIDAAALVGLVSAIGDEELDMRFAGLIALVASIGTTALAFGLGPALGLFGLPVAGAIGALGVGLVVSALFGIEIKRAFLIGLGFVVCHVAVTMAFGLMTR